MAWLTINLSAPSGWTKKYSKLYFYSTNNSFRGSLYTSKSTSSGATLGIGELATLASHPNYRYIGLYQNSDQHNRGSILIYTTGISTNMFELYGGQTTSITAYVGYTYPLFTFDLNYVNSTTLKLYRNDGNFYADEHCETEVVTSIDIPQRRRHVFDGFFDNADGTGTQYVSADGEFLPALHNSSATDKKIYARWILDSKYSAGFAGVEDYFELESPDMVAISSDSGDNRQRVCVSHLGRYATGVSETSGAWRNPTVTYSVVKDCTVSATLGKAFAATKSGTTMTTSGYMITGVTVETGAGRFPTVTVTGTANEGADAINKFKIEVPVVARARAQNLLGAVSGGGHLQSLTLTAQCDPVVVAERMMPCASDVVNGRVTVNASTLAPGLEAAPTASNGFTSVGEPKGESHASYRTYTITAQKEMA